MKKTILIALLFTLTAIGSDLIYHTRPQDTNNLQELRRRSAGMYYEPVKKQFLGSDITLELIVLPTVNLHQYRVLGYVLNSTVGGNIQIRDFTSNRTMLVVPCAANTPIYGWFEPGFLTDNLNDALSMVGPGVISGFLYYYDENQSGGPLVL